MPFLIMYTLHILLIYIYCLKCFLWGAHAQYHQTICAVKSQSRALATWHGLFMHFLVKSRSSTNAARGKTTTSKITNW